jgi:hypothetical protein
MQSQGINKYEAYLYPDFRFMGSRRGMSIQHPPPMNSSGKYLKVDGNEKKGGQEGDNKSASAWHCGEWRSRIISSLNVQFLF